MSHETDDLLAQFAQESGEVPAVEVTADVVDEVVSEVLIDETVVDGEGTTLPETLDKAEETQEIADQLEELADRVEDIAEKEEKQELAADVIAVSTESLHREFAAIMTSRKLVFSATSFEAAGTDKDRLKGLAADARRVARVSRGFSDGVRDYSSEGVIMQFLRRDAARLAKAESALQTAVGALKTTISTGTANAVAVRHEGMARFLTREGAPVRDLGAAIAVENKWLANLHDQVEAGVKAVEGLAKRLSTDPAGGIKAAGTINLGGLKTIGTSTGFLMGNHSVSLKENALGAAAVPKYKRTNAFDFQTGAALKSIGWSLLAGIGWSIVGGAVLTIGGIAAPGAASAIMGSKAYMWALRGMAAKSGVEKYQEIVNRTKTVSAASSQSLLAACNTVLGYKRYTDYRVSADGLQELIKAAKAGGAGLGVDEKRQLIKVCNDLDNSVDNLVRLADIGYEQAIYTTTMMASLTANVLRGAGNEE